MMNSSTAVCHPWSHHGSTNLFSIFECCSSQSACCAVA